MKFKGTSKNVIPTKVGIQNILKILDSGFRRNDKSEVSGCALKFLSLIALTFCLFTTSPLSAGTDRCYGLFTGDKINTDKFGTKPCVMMLFWSWDSRPFNIAALKEIWDTGAVPMITLEPWHPNSQKGVSLRDIAAGKEDALLAQFGKAINEFGHPVFIRFAHEMNGNWYPWAGAKNNNSADDYIKAYRHVHDVVAANAKGTEIYWVWAVNWEDVPNEEWNQAPKYYPGDKYVDAIAVDGYNWGDTKKWGHWRSFDEIFKEQLEMARTLAPKKQVFITEVASTTSGGDRSAWVQGLFDSLSKQYDFVSLFIWFDVDKETNWSITDEKTGLGSFKKGINSGFSGDRKKLLNSFSHGK